MSRNKPEIAFVDDTGTWAEIKRAGRDPLLINTARVSRMDVYSGEKSTCIDFWIDAQQITICNWSSREQAMADLKPIFARSNANVTVASSNASGIFAHCDAYGVGAPIFGNGFRR